MTPRAGAATYADFRTRTFSVEGAGPRLVLLHGYTDSAETWNGVLHELGAAGRSAIAVDLPGFGTADRVAPGPVMPQLDAFVTALVQAVSARDTVMLVGNSLGGSLSVRAAARELPILGAVTIGDPCAGSWPPRSWGGVARPPLPLRLASLPLPVPAPLFHLVARPILRSALYARRGTADPEVLDRFSTFLHSRGGLSWLIRDSTALAREIVAGHAQREVACRLLIVHGGKDRLVRVRDSKLLHAQVPGSELHIAPGWGHCPQLDDPVGLSQLLVRTVDRWTAATSSPAADAEI